MTTASGQALHGYKLWYLEQPKVIRVAALPGFIAILGAVLQIFPLADSIKIAGGAFFVLLLALAAYNQLIEADESDDYRERIAELEDESNNWRVESDFWLEKYCSASRLNKGFSELVLLKSKMWLDAIHELEEHGLDFARQFVRKKNALPENIQRIVTFIHKAFKEFVDPAMDEEIRVAYLGPNENGDRLELKSWCNSDAQLPKGIAKNADRFGRDSDTLASFVWAKSDEPIYFIDDVETYCEIHKDNTGVFSYLHNGQRSTIKSIFCYRIVDGMSGQCLGVLSIDSNVKGVFEGRISEGICRSIVTSAATRIIFEARFSVMESALGPYDGDNNHVGK